MNQVKTLILLIQVNKIMTKKIEDVDQKIPNTSKLLEIQDFNRLIRISFNLRETEASTNLTTQNQVENALDLGHKSKEKT